MTENIILKPIGHIESDYNQRPGTPAQGQGLINSIGKIIIYDDFFQGMAGIEIGDKLEVLFCFHQSITYDLKIVPYQREKVTGVFNTRSPDRPNPIGLSKVEVIKVEGSTLTFVGADMLNGSPVLDIKPVIEEAK
ncbi:tRNA (N6-threonylcarbamoyladenosine(37)-N6)-methyltransferase TrmO [Acidaminobacter sp. JC074]|uniref:tRNA (N6-threonylcarbamoyladenosine(37)-N6)-methyltransferase TrmO n=1 Tax=Acidaminobacter sp. JC074 TaxID=2530199 RepID=UPI001F0F2992|nr:tRNA (N6-threonylcarbamoyladenosine(37)-N6)-methyltransferase TrmO [Acidaminobacter sp. JC074]